MTTTAPDSRGLLSSLFDFRFTSFITLRFLRIIYAVVVVLVLLVGVVFFLGLARQGGGQAVLAILLVPVVTLLYLVFARVGLETIALFFRMGEDLAAVRAALTAGPASGPGAPGQGVTGPGYGPGPGYEPGPAYGPGPGYGSDPG